MLTVKDTRGLFRSCAVRMFMYTIHRFILNTWIDMYKCVLYTSSVIWVNPGTRSKAHLCYPGCNVWVAVMCMDVPFQPQTPTSRQSKFLTFDSSPVACFTSNTSVKQFPCYLSFSSWQLFPSPAVVQQLEGRDNEIFEIEGVAALSIHVQLNVWIALHA